jgi:hypothetical protein
MLFGNIFGKICNNFCPIFCFRKICMMKGFFYYYLFIYLKKACIILSGRDYNSTYSLKTV